MDGGIFGRRARDGEVVTWQQVVAGAVAAGSWRGTSANWREALVVVKALWGHFGAEQELQGFGWPAVS